MKTKSLTQQTLAIVLSAQLFCALILCGAALQHERHTRFRAFDTSLQGRSDSLLGAVQDAEDPDDNVTIDPTELRLPCEDVYAVYNKGGRLLGTSSAAPAAIVARGREGFRDVRVRGTTYRVLQRDALRVIDRAENSGVGLRRPVTIIYATPEAHLWHEIAEAAGFYVATIAAVALATVFLLLVLLRRAFFPLSELAAAAAGVSHPSLVFDPPASALRIHELRPLAEALTNSVARLREVFAREHRFVGDAAHELKTAIAVARSSVQVLMLKPRSGEEYSAGLGRILEDTQRVEALVTQMLQLARLEERNNAAPPTLNLTLSAAYVVTLLQPVAERHSVQVNFNRSPALYVRLQPELAEILLSNLLINAIQHSAPSSQVHLSLKGEGGMARIEVEDTGSGIGQDALPHIFERFYREDTSRSRETGGTGLGLAICKSIVDAAKGTIAAQSTQGVGTKLTVVFSLA